MPLVGLEDIEWAKLSHAYGSAVDVPDLLRTLDKAEKEEDFDRIFRELVNKVNHQGDIYDSTPYAVSFFLQILPRLSVLDNQHSSILWKLGGMLRDIQSFPFGFFDNPTEYSVVSVRANIATYDAVAQGLEYYLALLSNENEDIRLASLYILFALVEQREEILPNLVHCVDNISDDWFQACAVWTFANIAKFDSYSNKRDDYLKQLISWIENKNIAVIARYSAAFGHLRLSWALPETMTEHGWVTPQAVIASVVDALKADVWRSKGDIWGDKFDIYLELTPFNNPIQWITRHSTKPHTWITILQNLSPSPLQAHICVSEILGLAFVVKNVGDSLPKWSSYDFQDSDRTNIVYREAVSPERYEQGRPLNSIQRLALQAIVDCEPFWGIPTNLFSFFYGLPNDRDELRKLAQGE